MNEQSLQLLERAEFTLDLNFSHNHALSQLKKFSISSTIHSDKLWKYNLHLHSFEFQ